MNPARARATLERFWFAPIDARAAGALRILLGVTLPFFFLSGTRRLVAPEREALAWLYAHIVESPGHELTIVALGAALALGFRPRATAALLLLVLVPLLLAPGARASRQVLAFTLGAFAFVPSDAALTPFRRTPRGAAPGQAGPIWPIRLVQLQLSVLYGVNAWAKATPAYASGDVLVAMSAALPNFLVDLSTGALAVGPLALPVAWLAVGSVLAEAFLAVAFWVPRLRWGAAAVGIGFHATLRFMVQVHLLGWATQLLYLAFLLPWAARDEPEAGGG